jgi:hypothetical protein
VQTRHLSRTNGRKPLRARLAKRRGGRDEPGLMRISLSSIHQLFNSLDPSPFYEKDLDTAAEHYLVSWAQTLPRDVRLRLALHLRDRPPSEFSERSVSHAIARHFLERARATRLELDQLLAHGRMSLMIGVGILALFMSVAQFFAGEPANVGTSLLRESFLIAGWVAMWRPMQIYLYDWWPLRDRVRLFRRMARMPVTMRIADRHPQSPPAAK